MLDTSEVENIIGIGLNPGHDINLNTLKNLNRKKRYKFSKVLKDFTRNRNFGINVARNLFPSNGMKRKKISAKERPNSLSTVADQMAAKAENVPNLAWID